MKDGIHNWATNRHDLHIDVHELELDQLVSTERAILGKLRPHPIYCHTTGQLWISFVGLGRHMHETFDITMSHEDPPVWVDRMVLQEVCRDILHLKVLVSVSFV